MIVTVPVCVSPEVKLYLSSRLDVAPFVLTRKNIYGLFLFNQLARYRDSDKRRDAATDMSRYPDQMQIRISEDVFLRKGFYFSNVRQIDFNLFVQREMFGDFYRYMEFYHQLNGVQLRQCIHDWMARNNLNEDVLGARTLEKSYERHRKSYKLLKVS